MIATAFTLTNIGIFLIGIVTGALIARISK